MFVQRRFRSVCISLQSDQSFLSTWRNLESLVIHRVPSEDWWDYADLGPVVQNLMKLLANVIKISILKYGKYIDIFCCKNVSSFCDAKATHIFAAKISMYENTLATIVNKFFIKELVKLMMLWTAEPESLLGAFMSWDSFSPAVANILGMFYFSAGDWLRRSIWWYF